MSRTEVLLVGESWVTAATHYKGFDSFSSVTFHKGANRWWRRCATAISR